MTVSPLWLALASGAMLTAGLSLGVKSPALSTAGFWRPDPRSWLRGPRLQLRRIEFVGLQTLEAAQLSRRLQLPEGGQLIDVDADRACREISGNPRVARCSALRLPPDALLVEIEERRPVARLPRPGMGVAGDGVVLALLPGEEKGLPRIEGDLKSALRLLQVAGRAGLEIESIEARDSNDLAFRPAGTDLRVRVGRNLDAALRGWTQMRRSGLIERYGAHEVDLRFRGGAVLRDFEANHRGR